MKKEELPKVPEIMEECERKIPSDVTPEQAAAINLAEEYGLGAEVEYAIFVQGMSPEEALDEWDLRSDSPEP